MGRANRGSVIRSDRSETSADIKAAQSDVAQGDAITRRPRKLESRPAWKRSDLRIALDLALLLLPSWILPERLWGPLCRATMHKSSSTKQRGIKSNAETIRAALDEADVARSEAIAFELKVGIQELRLQDLRGWRPGGWSPKIVVEGEEHLRSALAGGSGAILWVAPFVFNSAPTKIALHQKGHRVSHLSSPKHGFSETEFGVKFLNRIRCIPEDRYLAARIIFDRNLPSTAMRRMMRALKAGEVVSIVAASTEGSDMVKGPIFGGRLPVAVGAPRLAALTGAPLLPLFTVRDPEAGFRIVVEAPIALASDQSSDERCIAATAEFLRRSERWVRQFPGQWRAWSKWRRN